MRKLVAGLFITLDGIVDSPANSPKKWSNAEMAERIAAGVAQADTVLLGPRTYRLLAQFWQHQSDDIPMACFLNRSRKYVVSHTPDNLEWQPATLIQGNLAEEVAKLKEQPGKNIQIPGSPRLVRSLLRLGMLDELNLNICPVVAGTGLRLFDDLDSPLPLQLVDARTYTNGVLGVSYRLVRLTGGTK
ncbi:dihydrofolate reductase family protein [Cohnella faecalis]|uniref:dihydrofolate reductase family protein n=1 Tax=Cohnella faecalis TaxID=2315694 RepID=UPI001314F3FF|nr:dihydrofolate reductase family protein [Cohnella faecalis]